MGRGRARDRGARRPGGAAGAADDADRDLHHRACRQRAWRRPRPHHALGRQRHRRRGCRRRGPRRTAVRRRHRSRRRHTSAARAGVSIRRPRHRRRRDQHDPRPLPRVRPGPGAVSAGRRRRRRRRGRAAARRLRRRRPPGFAEAGAVVARLGGARSTASNGSTSIRRGATIRRCGWRARSSTTRSARCRRWPCSPTTAAACCRAGRPSRRGAASSA